MPTKTTSRLQRLEIIFQPHKPDRAQQQFEVLQMMLPPAEWAACQKAMECDDLTDEDSVALRKVIPFMQQLPGLMNW